MATSTSDQKIYFSKLNVPVGDFYLAANNQGIVLGSFGKSFADSREELVKKLGVTFLPAKVGGVSKAEQHIKRATAMLKDYFAGKKVDFQKIPVASVGTPFQKKLWENLRAIPYGAALSYGDLAKKLKLRGGARAIGGACGSNPVAIIVPCHRVLRADRTIGGFSGGLANKKILLGIEKIEVRR